MEYYTVKGWRPAVEHPVGPGTPTHPTIGFNFHHNKLVYQKLESATRCGPALIQVEKSTKTDGRNAWRNLLNRYDGFTPRDIGVKLSSILMAPTSLSALTNLNFLLADSTDMANSLKDDKLICRLKDSATEDTYKAMKTVINQHTLPGQTPFS